MSAQHAPGPSMTHKEAMALAVLAATEANKLRDTGRPCFAEQATQMEDLSKRLVRWIETPPNTELTIAEINALPVRKARIPMGLNDYIVDLCRAAGRAAIAKAVEGAQS